MRAHAYSQTAQKWFQAIWIFIIKFIKQHQATILVNWIGFCAMFFPQHFGHSWVEGGLHPPPWHRGTRGTGWAGSDSSCFHGCARIFEGIPSSRSRRGQMILSLLLATPESRVELLHNLGPKPRIRGTWHAMGQWGELESDWMWVKRIRNVSKLFEITPRSE